MSIAKMGSGASRGSMIATVTKPSDRVWWKTATVYQSESINAAGADFSLSREH